MKHIQTIIFMYSLTLTYSLTYSSNLPPYKTINGKCRDYLHYYNENINMCCSQCFPGQYHKEECTNNKDTVCERCENGTYTSIYNYIPHCLSCTVCTSDQVEIKPCTKTQNRVCVCDIEHYCILKSRNNGCKVCAPKRKCPVGEGVSGFDSMGNVICKECPHGSYSDKVSATEWCMPHFRCPKEYLRLLSGTKDKNTVCA
ncbi:Truncated TNFa-receptor [Eptesipox virus]|uniref:Truncated TNFa-receptor n=1 Tax=Eptesipox virus TaxID=1329402 RepID=A0A220T6N6_9POXV|nr:Truncated TNFa-receptor [Eptesipox virus]ASK51378.1 Truncated TNFa-receptor [Eptesipox virus]WAH71136.1 truncated TNFa-receptor [Eptesipox virus]